MLTKIDIEQLGKKGITEQQVNNQLDQIKLGSAYLRIVAPAAVGSGILLKKGNEIDTYIEAWNSYIRGGASIVKFVPASGAASRMFKDLFAFLDADYDVPTTEFEKTFFDNIRMFAFRESLCDKCKQNEGKNIKTLIADREYKAIVDNLLNDKGLNYGNLPKGLLLFHDYKDGARTAMEEHLAEAAMYASSDGKANIHFTVSNEHVELFKNKVAEVLQVYEKHFGINYNITFSVQSASTDTIAANMDSTPFRNEDGSLLFRPGGHGALINNLNEIDGDVVFIKNIDNVVPDGFKKDTVTYKQLIGGVLVTIQRQVFDYLKLIDSQQYTRLQLNEILAFVENNLYCKKEGTANLNDEELAKYLHQKLNRPIRVCGMVKNIGEPGGGPFLAYNQDGSVSLQILESTQIDSNNAEYMKMFMEGTHFNPVDLVCAKKDYRGKPFNLPDYVDEQTGFISIKSKNGKQLKALELPGLWNGAMSDWNTVFVEVPLSTFNPVKTVNDLLRDEHQ